MAEAQDLDSATRFVNEPASRWTQAAFDDLLRWACTHDASDVKVLPKRPLCASINGVWTDITRRRLQSDEIFGLLHGMAGDIARSKIVASDDWDFAYEVKLVNQDPSEALLIGSAANSERVRFRGNASGCRDGWATGVEVTLRLIADRPPPMSAIGLPDELYRACCPQNGLVLFTGVTGTGKTTSMAAILREINTTKPWAIATYEQPIEFDLTDLPGAMGPLSQSEIPKHFKSFDVAARNAARRAENLVLVGEARDEATLEAMLRLAEMGHRVFSTSHTLSVSATPMRVIAEFPYQKHSHAASALFTVIRTIVQQRLVPRLDPETQKPAGRIALREYLEFDDGMRSRLMRVRVEDIGTEVERMVRQHGLALLADAKAKFKDGLISRATLEAIEYEYRDREGGRDLRTEERVTTEEATARVA